MTTDNQNPMALDALINDAARLGLAGCARTGGSLACGRCDSVCDLGPREYVIGVRTDTSGDCKLEGYIVRHQCGAACNLIPAAALDEVLFDIVAAAARQPAGVAQIIHAHALAQSTRKGLAENYAAQREGRADFFGLDPTDRHRAWAGRFDGADEEDLDIYAASDALDALAADAGAA